jgi:Ca2+-binding RTX toxin-like protein
MLESLESRRLLSFSVSGGVLTVTGTSNPDNILVRKDGTDLTIVENGVNGTTAAADVTSIVIHGNAGNDKLAIAVGLDHGISLPTVLNGGDGNDQLLGGEGNDVENGGNGNDVMNGGPRGKDTFNGGAGRDRVDYGGRREALVLTIDGVANDGAPEAPATATLPARPAEGDNIGTDVEDVGGGNGNDKISGSGGNNAVNGGGGNDQINGGGGNDQLRGDAGNDVLSGGDGNDGMIGGPGADVFNGGGGIDAADYHDARSNLVITIDNVANDGAPALAATATQPARPAENDNVKGDVENVIGGAGADKITGSPQANRLVGGPGNDELRGNDGNDILDGQGGVDKLFGGNGNDFLIDIDHDASADSLDGGDGDDSSANDANAILVSVEHPNQPLPTPPAP